MSISCDIFLLFKDICRLILAIFGIIGGHLCLACDYFLKKMAQTAVRTQGTTYNSLKIVLVSILHV